MAPILLTVNVAVTLVDNVDLGVRYGTTGLGWMVHCIVLLYGWNGLDVD